MSDQATSVDLASFGLADMVRLSVQLRELGTGAGSVEEFATRLCGHLWDELRGPDGASQVVLVRCYGTVPYAALPPAEREFVRGPGGVAEPADDLTCLTLLGTRGRRPEWDDRRASRGHRVLPLSDERAVARLPMVAALLEQLGIDVPALVGARDALLTSAGRHRCGVFHVDAALGSPAIPAQDFVVEHDVDSVLGFGGMLPTGEVYAVVVFAGVPVPAATAQLFETVALSTTLAALEMLDTPVFVGCPPAPSRGLSDGKRGAVREEVFRALLETHEQVAVAEATAAAVALDRAGHEVQRYGALAARMEQAQAVAGFGLWDWDLATGVVAWDAHCAALFGHPAQARTGDIAMFRADLHPDDAARMAGELDRARERGGPVELEYRALWPDGTLRHHFSRGSTLADEAGRPARMLGAVLDVTELRSASDARSRLAQVALRLAQAQTVEEVNDVVLEDGFAALGAAGGSIMLRTADETSLEVTLSGVYDPGIRQSFSLLPLDFDAPSAHAARTGEPQYFSDLDALLAVFPGEAEVLRAARVEAVASLPLRVAGRLLGSLTATWTERHGFSEDDVALLSALAAQCSQALARAQARLTEQQASAAARSMSEALQRSLLTSPPDSAGLQIAVRYSPAAQEVQVGGDWYDAFPIPSGATCLVIGDVTGHDRDAAATMGQVRNLLRATAYAVEEPPGLVLEALERTMNGLDVPALATAVLACIEPPADPAGRGPRRLLWSNAGHLPPMLRSPDGTTRVLGTDANADLMLGVVAATSRTDSAVDVLPGSTLLLYTDGLIEHRGEDLDVGLSRLREALDRLGGLPVDEMCNALLGQLLREDADDDVALVAVRFAGPDVDLQVAERTFVPEPESVSAARLFLAGCFAEWGLADRLWEARQVLSELATNCVLHAATPYTVRLRVRQDGLRVEVEDGGRRPPRERHYGPESTTGRGMGMVGALSLAWGVSHHDAGKTVWCELPLGGDD
jgi:serine phosphatase RsbU (regulator of sigma subunit)/PAS domain-containing protein/anti-sigma regulatory factor (Ser/Thr protein kinase)